MPDDELSLTDLQAEILEQRKQNPDQTQAEIADSVGCSPQHVSNTLKKYDTVDLSTHDISPSSSASHPKWGKAGVVAALAVGAQILAVVNLFNSSLQIAAGNAWLLFISGWLVAPPAIFADALSLHRLNAPVRPNRLTWAAGSLFIPLLVPGAYLIKRL